MTQEQLNKANTLQIEIKALKTFLSTADKAMVAYNDAVESKEIHSIDFALTVTDSSSNVKLVEQVSYKLHARDEAERAMFGEMLRIMVTGRERQLANLIEQFEQI